MLPSRSSISAVKITNSKFVWPLSEVGWPLRQICSNRLNNNPVLLLSECDLPNSVYQQGWTKKRHTINFPCEVEYDYHSGVPNTNPWFWMRFALLRFSMLCFVYCFSMSLSCGLFVFLFLWCQFTFDFLQLICCLCLFTFHYSLPWISVFEVFLWSAFSERYVCFSPFITRWNMFFWKKRNW